MHQQHSKLRAWSELEFTLQRGPIHGAGRVKQRVLRVPPALQPAGPQPPRWTPPAKKRETPQWICRKCGTENNELKKWCRRCDKHWWKNMDWKNPSERKSW